MEKEEEVEEEEQENYSPQTEPTWEQKRALSGADSILCAGGIVFPLGSPVKGTHQPEKRL